MESDEITKINILNCTTNGADEAEERTRQEQILLTLNLTIMTLNHLAPEITSRLVLLHIVSIELTQKKTKREKRT